MNSTQSCLTVLKRTVLVGYFREYMEKIQVLDFLSSAGEGGTCEPILGSCAPARKRPHKDWSYLISCPLSCSSFRQCHRFPILEYLNPQTEFVIGGLLYCLLCDLVYPASSSHSVLSKINLPPLFSHKCHRNVEAKYARATFQFGIMRSNPNQLRRQKHICTMTGVYTKLNQPYKLAYKSSFNVKFETYLAIACGPRIVLQVYLRNVIDMQIQKICGTTLTCRRELVLH